MLFVVNDKFDTGNAQGFGEGVKGRASSVTTQWPQTLASDWPLPPDAGTRKRSADNTHNSLYAPLPPSPSGDTTASHWICHFCLFIPVPGGIVRLEIKTSDIRDTSRSPRVSEVFLLFIQRSSLRSADCVFGAGMSRFSNRLLCQHAHTHTQSGQCFSGRLDYPRVFVFRYSWFSRKAQ